MRERILVAVALAALCAALVVPSAAPASSRPVALTSLKRGVLAKLNAIRARHGLVPLRLSASLDAAAAQHSREMGTVGYFAHASVDGAAPWKRIGRWYGSRGHGYWAVGENLLWASPSLDPTTAVEDWMRSPEHRANILTARWREIGVSALHLASAPGIYHGLPVTIITADFGVRR